MLPSSCQANDEPSFEMLQKKKKKEGKCELDPFPSTDLEQIN